MGCTELDVNAQLSRARSAVTKIRARQRPAVGFKSLNTRLSNSEFFLPYDSNEIIVARGEAEVSTTGEMSWC